MQYIDVLLICLSLLILEKLILKSEYILFSPYTMFNLSFLFIYYLPLLLYQLDGNYNLIQTVNLETISNLANNIRLFIYAFSLIEFFLLLRIRNLRKTETYLNIEFDDNYLTFVSLFSFVVILGIQLVMVGFDSSLLIDKLLRPRLYTYLREGIGPLTYLVEVTKKVFLFVCLVNNQRKRSLISLALLFISVSLNVLGGSKTSIIIIVIFYVIITQRMSRRRMIIKLRDFIKYVTLLALALVISFFVMSREEETLSTAVKSLLYYPQEAYYSSLVLRDFEPNIEHHKELVKSIVLTPIPRAIFSNKSFYGFYSNYWRPLYQPNTVVYHTSTYGFFAEAQMLFGKFGWLIYAFLLNGLLYKLHCSLKKDESIKDVFFSVYAVSQIYFIMRVGFFDASFFWGVMMHLIGSSILLNVPIGRRKISKESRSHNGSEKLHYFKI